MSTTIYFSGSITGGREDVPVYRRIIGELEAAGHRVLAGAVGAEHVGAEGETLQVAEIFARDIAWLDEADLVVADVSTPSHGVGYEIGYARHKRGIPVVALFRAGRTGRCSAMISGDPCIELIEYMDVDGMLPRLMESIRRSRRYPDRPDEPSS